MQQTSFSWLWLVALAGVVGGCAARSGPHEQSARQAAVVTLQKISFFEPAQVLEGNFQADALTRWVKQVEQLSRRMGHQQGEQRDVVIQVTLHKQRPADYDVAARPALPSAQRQAYLDALAALTPMHTRFFDITFQLLFRVNRGSANAKEALAPALRKPLIEELGRFKRASTAQQLVELRRWAWEEILPYLAMLATKAEPRLSGLRSLGAALHGLQAPPSHAATLTEQSAVFWRALTEMDRGDQHVAAIYIFLRVANGELDIAERLLALSLLFADENVPSSFVLQYLKAKLDIFYGVVHAEIKRGIALNDQRRFSEALAIFERLLAQYPRSAWARYEQFFSLRLWKGEQAANWAAASREVYAADPLFPTDAKASTGREAYLALRRFELRNLLQNRMRVAQDYLTYADIALELGVHGIAALLYWQALSLFQPEFQGGRDLLARFLYCLERLGVKELQRSFKGNFAPRFRRLERELQQQMKSSPAFKTMRRKS